MSKLITWQAKPFRAALEHFASRGEIEGWPANGAWWMVNLTNDRGERFQLMRRFDRGAEAQNFMSSRQPGDVNGVAFPVFGADEVYLGPVHITFRDAVEYRPSDGGQPDFRITVDSDCHTTWNDAAGRIDVTLTPRHYLTEPLIASGNFLGRPVTGVGMFDAAFANPDRDAAMGFFAGSGGKPTRDWIVFQNLYPDGGRDFGLFVKLQLGADADPVGVCYYAHDDDTSLGQECTITPTFAADGMIQTSDVTMDGHRFVFEPEAHIYDANPAKHWVAGNVRNTDLGVEPVESWAWYEWLADEA